MSTSSVTTALDPEPRPGSSIVSTTARRRRPSLEPAPPVEAFRIDVHPEREVVRVVPAGELDLPRAGELAAKLHELVEAGFEHVVLDLQHLALLEPDAIALIVAEERGARRSGRRLSLVNGPPAVEHALREPDPAPAVVQVG